MTIHSRTFTFDYRVRVRAHDAELDLWLPAPRTDAYQRVISTRIAAPVELDLMEDPVDHNHILHGRLPATQIDQDVVVRHEIERRVRRTAAPHDRGGRDPAGGPDLARFLQADSQVPIDGPVVEAAGAISRHAPPLERARQIFDNLLGTLDYDARGCTPQRAHELGDLAVACDLRRGTCTEFHGLYVAHARALGLPARFAFGFNIPPKPAGSIAGYHCWAEVFVPEAGGWLAVDVSEAWKRDDPGERDFYFGNLDANRVQFTMGRDVVLVPPSRTGAVDRFIFPLAEMAGQRIDVALAFSFENAA